MPDAPREVLPLPGHRLGWQWVEQGGRTTRLLQMEDGRWEVSYRGSFSDIFSGFALSLDGLREFAQLMPTPEGGAPGYTTLCDWPILIEHTGGLYTYSLMGSATDISLGGAAWVGSPEFGAQLVHWIKHGLSTMRGPAERADLGVLLHAPRRGEVAAR